MDNEINNLKSLFIKLYNMIVNQDDDFKYTTEKFIRQIIYLLEVYNEDSSSEYETEIKRVYEDLYSLRGGLTDFFFWDNNFEKREKMNMDLENLKKEISILMKKLFYKEKEQN